MGTEQQRKKRTLDAFSPEDLETLKDGIRATFHAVASDVPEAVSGSPEIMAEAVLDADRMLMYGGEQLTRELYDRFMDLPYTVMEDFTIKTLGGDR